MLGFGPVGSFPVGGLPDEGAAIAYSLAAETGSFALTGVATTFTVTQASATGSFAFTGIDVGFTISLVADTGSYALTGGDASCHIGQDPTLTVLMPRKVGVGSGQTISRKKIARFLDDDRDRKRREAERVKANADRKARKEREAKERTARLAAEALRDRIDGIDRNSALNHAAAIQASSGDVMANTQRLLALARETAAARDYAMRQAVAMEQARDDEDVFSILAA